VVARLRRVTDTMPASATREPGEEPTAPAPRRRPALSPSRAGDFKQCPLLYRFRAVDRLPEQPTRAQVRGTVVHAVLERLYRLPAAERLPDRARQLLDPVWAELTEAEPKLAELFEGTDAPELAGWLESAACCWTPTSPWRTRAGWSEACEQLVEAETESGLLLRAMWTGWTWRPPGSSGWSTTRPGGAQGDRRGRALFQMKFYALVLLLTRGVVPSQLRLMYLADGEALTYRRTNRSCAGSPHPGRDLGGDPARRENRGLPPQPQPALRLVQPPGTVPGVRRTPPEYPGWPEPDPAVTGGESLLDRAE